VTLIHLGTLQIRLYSSLHAEQYHRLVGPTTCTGIPTEKCADEINVTGFTNVITQQIIEVLIL